MLEDKVTNLQEYQRSTNELLADHTQSIGVIRKEIELNRMLAERSLETQQSMQHDVHEIDKKLEWMGGKLTGIAGALTAIGVIVGIFGTLVATSWNFIKKIVT